ncbi:MAG: hypothetical protein JXQ87_18245 [Bacteroidia bacterium]
MRILSIVIFVCFIAACGSKKEEGGEISDTTSTEETTLENGEADELNGNEDVNSENTEITDSVSNEKTEEESVEELDSGNADTESPNLSAAMAELDNFSSNISLESDNVTKRLLSRYDYKLYVENRNKVLSLESVKVRVVYIDKKGANLGETTISRTMDVLPGEKKMIDWGIDWIKLKEGTKGCEFSIIESTSNIDSFKADVEA